MWITGNILMYKVILFLCIQSLLALSNASMNICIRKNGTNLEEYIPSESLNIMRSNLISEGNNFDQEINNNSVHYDIFKFNFTHPAISAEGELTDYNISNFMDTYLRILDFSPDSGFQVFNLTYHNISLAGNYELTGDIGDLFSIMGDGTFWLNMINMSVALNVSLLEVSLNKSGLCVPLDIELYIQKVEGNFENLMYDEEVGDIINRAIMYLLPDAIRIIWSEVEAPLLQDSIQSMVDNIINGNVTGNTVSKLFTTLQTDLKLLIK